MEDLFPLESLWMVDLATGALALIMLWQLARALPAQNIVLIVVSLLVGEGVLGWSLAKYARIDVIGPMWFYVGGSALLWLAVVLSARRLAKLILGPWRRAKYYGVWLIILSAIATAAFQYGWPRLDPDFHNQQKAAIMAAIRGGTTAVFLVALMPWFIRKRPVSRARRSELAQQPKNQTQ
jgi:hypothetical protein